MKTNIVAAVLVVVLMSAFSTEASAHHGYRFYRPVIRVCAPVVRYCPPPVAYVRPCPPPVIYAPPVVYARPRGYYGREYREMPRYNRGYERRGYRQEHYRRY